MVKTGQGHYLSAGTLFPKEGTFRQQRDYVGRLPPAPPRPTHTACNIIEAAAAPLSVRPEDLPEGVDVTIHHHVATSSSGPASSHGERVAAVVTRDVDIREGERKDKICITMPDGASGQTLTLLFGPDGTLGLFRREVSMEEVRLGLEAAQGFAVEAHSAVREDDATYTTFTRPGADAAGGAGTRTPSAGEAPTGPTHWRLGAP